MGGGTKISQNGNLGEPNFAPLSVSLPALFHDTLLTCIAVILGFQKRFLLFVNQLVSCFISIPVMRMISAFSVSVG